MSKGSTAITHLDNPFPGLRPFQEDEEYLFFGRESQVDAMIDKLAAKRILAVVGTSGSGKSSLVNCGLRPALHGGRMGRAGTAWRMAQFRPGSDPLGAMARALAADGVLFSDFEDKGLALEEIISTTLRMSKLGLIDIFQQSQMEPGTNLLIIVDQFEELFRFHQLGRGVQEDEFGVGVEATAFVNLLLEAAKQVTDPIYVVLTMRSDFLGDCAQFSGLAEAINMGQFLVPRMSRDERRAAISGPAAVGGGKISPILLTRLVNDVGDNPDQLSILQHALNRTWARAQNDEDGGHEGSLELSHYEAIGTMAHALDQHAEIAHAELKTPRQQQLCEKVFKALTDKATDERGVRRPTTLSALCALVDATEAEVSEVIEVFRDPTRSFLMPPAGEGLHHDTVIDISHETLLRVWGRLGKWAEEEAASAQIYRRLAETASLHKAGKASLWRNPDLQLALDWRETSEPNETWGALYHKGFTEAMEFLDESREASEAEEAEREAQRQRELAAEQEKSEAQARYASRMRWAALISGAVAVIAVIVGVIAFAAENRAQEAEWEARQNLQSANEARNQARKEVETANAVNTFLRGIFEETDPVALSGRYFGKTSGGSEKSILDVIQAGTDQVESSFQDRPEVRAMLQHTLGNVWLSFGKNEKAAVLIEKSMAVREQILPPDHLDRIASNHLYGRVEYARGHFRRSGALYKKALHQCRRRLAEGLGEGDRERADILLAEIAFDLGVLVYQGGTKDLAEERAESLFQESLKIRERIFGKESREVCVTLIGLTLMKQEGAEALSYLQRVAKLLDKLNDGRIFETAAKLLVDAKTAEFLKQYGPSEIAYRNSLALAVEGLGEDHVLVTTIRRQLAFMLYWKAKANEKAEKEFKLLLGNYQKNFGDSHIQTALVHVYLARCRRNEKDFPTAKIHANKSVEIYLADRESDPTNLATALHVWRAIQMYDSSREREQEGILLGPAWVEAEHAIDKILELRDFLETVPGDAAKDVLKYAVQHKVSLKKTRQSDTETALGDLDAIRQLPPALSTAYLDLRARLLAKQEPEEEAAPQAPR